MGRTDGEMMFRGSGTKTTRIFMSTETRNDWNPRAARGARRPDRRLRRDAPRCPVAHSDYLWWSLFRHADVLRVLEDPQSFSNAASNHLSIPNAMDPPEHTPYREIIDRYFDRRRDDGLRAAVPGHCRGAGPRLAA
jgi:cytochrome P450